MSKLSTLTASWSVLLMAGKINFKNKCVETLYLPTWSGAFKNVLSAKKADERASLFRMVINSILRQESDYKEYDLTDKGDLQSTFESMYSIPDTIVKLVAACKFATDLVETIDQASPVVDMYCFMP